MLDWPQNFVGIFFLVAEDDELLFLHEVGWMFLCCGESPQRGATCTPPPFKGIMIMQHKLLSFLVTACCAIKILFNSNVFFYLKNINSLKDTPFHVLVSYLIHWFNEFIVCYLGRHLIVEKLPFSFINHHCPAVKYRNAPLKTGKTVIFRWFFFFQHFHVQNRANANVATWDFALSGLSC